MSNAINTLHAHAPRDHRAGRVGEHRGDPAAGRLLPWWTRAASAGGLVLACGAMGLAFEDRGGGYDLALGCYLLAGVSLFCLIGIRVARLPAVAHGVAVCLGATMLLSIGVLEAVLNWPPAAGELAPSAVPPVFGWVAVMPILAGLLVGGATLEPRRRDRWVTRVTFLATLAWFMAGSSLLFSLAQPEAIALPQGAPLLALLWVGYPLAWGLAYALVQHQFWQVSARRKAELETRLRQAKADRARRHANAAFDQAAVGAVLMDRNGRWLRVNGALSEMLGRPAEALRGNTFRDVTHPTEISDDALHLHRLMQRRCDTAVFERHLEHGDTTRPLWVRVHLTRVDDPRPADTQVLGIVYDITEQREARRDLQALNDRIDDKVAARTESLIGSGRFMQARTAAMFDLLIMLGLLPTASDRHHVHQLIAEHTERILPGSAGVLYLRGDLPGRLRAAVTWGDNPCWAPTCVDADCRAMRAGQSATTSATGTGAVCQHSALASADDSVPASICHPLQADGETIGLMSIAWPQPSNGVSEADWFSLARTLGDQIAIALSNLRLRQRLEHAALHDPLTGLLNRVSLSSRMAQTLALAQRERSPVAVALIDVDHFKRFNDDYGHKAGDTVLVQMAKALNASHRASDHCFRLGGEEFLCVLPDTNAEGAKIWADRLRDRIHAITLEDAGKPMRGITASCGIAMFPADSADQETLYRQADAAMYAAKHAGRDAIRFYADVGDMQPLKLIKS